MLVNWTVSKFRAVVGVRWLLKHYREIEKLRSGDDPMCIQIDSESLWIHI